MKQEGLNHDQITDFNVCVTIVKTSVEHKKSLKKNHTHKKAI